MIDKKEKVENIVPLEGHVKAEIILPSTFKTKSGIILTNNREKIFKEVEFYNVKIIEVAKGCPKNIKVGKTFKTDKFSGVAIPTEGESFIKVIPHGMLIGEDAKKAKDYKPHEDRILVKVTSLSDKTKSGIYAPGNSGSIFETDTLGGEIISVSEDLKDFYKAGDKIRWEAHGGMEVPFEEDTEHRYRSIQKYSVVCKIR